MPTRFMQQIYKNVDKAIAYDPERQDRPYFDLHQRPAKKIVIQDNLGPVQKARALKKQ